MLDDLRHSFERYGRTLLSAYAVSAWLWVLINMFGPRHTALVFFAFAWPLLPAGLVAWVTGARGQHPVAVVGAILFNGAVYALIWIGARELLRRRRARRPESRRAAK